MAENFDFVMDELSDEMLEGVAGGQLEGILAENALDKMRGAKQNGLSYEQYYQFYQDTLESAAERYGRASRQYYHVLDTLDFIRDHWDEC
ncbi:MAG: hypothetical protein J6D34_01335 [Atopobiaceae bacterium]|nr:hypothetical protein [Atopobiaceae bacterium]